MAMTNTRHWAYPIYIWLQRKSVACMMLHPSQRNCNWKVSFPLLYSWQKPWEEALILCRNTAHSKLTVLHRGTRAVDKLRQHREHPTRCRTPSPTGRAWTLPRVQNPPSLDEQRGGALDHLKKIWNLLSLEFVHADYGIYRKLPSGTYGYLYLCVNYRLTFPTNFTAVTKRAFL